MLNIEKYLAKLMSLLITVISFVPAFMYSYIFANFFTMYLFQWDRPTYRQIGSRNQNRKNIKKVLDIGTATGDALSTIVDDLKEAHILGIDYNEFYVPACKKRFESKPNVEIRFMNFYNLEKEESETLFDIIIFGSSFMLMPDQVKALEIAKSTFISYSGKLNKNGKIYFLQTLFHERTLYVRMLAYIKPILKYLTTIDFGKVLFKKEFEEFLVNNELRIVWSERCLGNFFLKTTTFYIY